jgi:two-component system NtrC family sensor kinase
MLAEVLSGGVGEHHLRILAEALGRALNAQAVLIGQVAGVSGELVQTIALYRDGKIVENGPYPLPGTPCEIVLAEGMRVYKSKVCQQFPRDRALQEIRAEAYVGMPLVDSLGRVLGLLSVIFSKPVRDPVRATTLLRIFGARAALELERNLMDQHMFRQLTAAL